ncbi:DUF4910 domain-containing protein [uncultured Methylobacterium sp.]|uniref:DUF4910 domain-containing protein n=1 Tax=uncultured Methylobacterium sp. TaxID=157278 RepID=UPI00263092B9|nr:DUF4910 domain-containing protein [uncultured Methylobacterium sp.]
MRTSPAIFAPHDPVALPDGRDGAAMHGLMADLYPICRSITGDGVRETLRGISRHLPLTVTEVPSGLPVFDWTVPLEWNIRDAYIKNRAGERVVDFRKSNLHVVSYSTPIRCRIGLAELKKHLHWDEANPDWIPYRTAYYRQTWGFCLSYNQMLALTDDEYEVCIKSTLRPGHLTYGELFLKGRSDDEVLISCHVCHPSLANDNLSGIAVATALAQHLDRLDLRYSYRFLFIPGTIGSITWIALNQDRLSRIKHGFVLTCVGDGGPPTYKESRRGDAEIDRAWKFVLGATGDGATRPFSPYGYDERQFCSPGINLPVGCFMRTPHGEFPQYHTSADDLDFVDPRALEDSLTRAIDVIDVLENNAYYLNQKSCCEPKLGKYDLYNGIGGGSAGAYQMALLWLLNMSDGHNSLLDIAARAGLDWGTIKRAAEALCKAELLVPARLPVA